MSIYYNVHGKCIQISNNLQPNIYPLQSITIYYICVNRQGGKPLVTYIIKIRGEDGPSSGSYDR